MKKIQLGIPQPCHENWNNMKPEEKGRFCSACQKTVMDFREMSDRQLAEFFKKPAGSVCGRFNTDQLNRDIQIPRKHIPWVKYFFQFSLPAFLFSMKAAAQGRVVVQEKTFVQEKTGFGTADNEKILNRDNKDSVLKNDHITLKGKITDETGTPLYQASIIIKGTNIGTITDENGQFVLKCKTGDIAYASSVGFMTQEFKIRDTSINIKLMQLDSQMLGEVVIISCHFNENTNSKRTPVVAQPIDSNKKVLKVFPNPVISSQLIKIDVSKLGKGDYEIKLLSSDGSLIRSRSYHHESETNWIEERTNGLRPGNYYIHFVNKQTGKIITEKIIVQ